MSPVSLKQISDWCGGALLQGVPSDEVTDLNTDTRSIEKGDLFLALKGENFDAHKFLENAVEAEAAAMIVQSLEKETESYTGGLIHVKNTLVGLQSLAAGYRRSLTDFFAVGVTGSNGKTSTKDFLRSVLGKNSPVNATPGNLNNHIGLPITILRTESHHRFGVWEMGMNHPGEIEILAEIAAPDAAVITNIGRAHIEHMKTREAIANEKLELAMAIPKDGFCVMPFRDDYFDFAKERVSCELISVGIDCGDVIATDVKNSEDGGMSFSFSIDGGERFPVTIPVSGEHMVSNALLAVAVGSRCGLGGAQIAEGLSTAELTGGRLQRKVVGDLQFLDDSYNANPDSMRAAFSTIRDLSCSGQRVAVLGMMGELGELEKEEHQQLGGDAAGLGIDQIVTVGETAAMIAEGANGAIPCESFDSHAAAADYLKKTLTSDDLILVKGSRSAGMEKVISAI